MNPKMKSGAAGLPGIILTVVAVLLVIGIFILIIKPRPAEIMPASTTTPVSVSVTPVTRQDITETITYAGSILAQTSAVLAVENGGQIVAINADKGQRVSIGQPLLSIDHRAAQINFDRAKINHKQAEADLTRWKELKQSGSVALSDLENMQTRMNLAAVALDECRLMLDKCILTAPFDGVIADKYVEIGEMAVPGLHVMRLINIDQVKVALDVAESDVSIIRIGQSAAISLEALPGQIFTGKVVYISASATPHSNSFRTELVVANPYHQLRPGMIGRLNLDRRSISNAMIVPLAALIPSKGQYIAFVATDGRAVRRVVKLDAIVANRAVVSAGLETGEQVVVEGNRAMSDGQAIAVTPLAAN